MKDREAALHFTRYLCNTGVVSGNNGSVSRDLIRNVFVEEYQPTFASPLQLDTLFKSLAIAKVLKKKRSSSDFENLEFNWSKVVNEGLAEGRGRELPALPEDVIRPKQKVIATQRLNFKPDFPEHPKASGNRCEICNLNFSSPEEVLVHSEEDELHKLRLQYRKRKKDFETLSDKMLIWLDGREKDSRDFEISFNVSEEKVWLIKFENRLADAKVEDIFELIPLPGIKLENNLTPCSFMKGFPLSMNLVVNLLWPSTYLYPLVFKVLRAGVNEPEYHLQEIKLLVESELNTILKPTAPYELPKGPVIRLTLGSIIPGRAIPIRTHKLKNTLSLAKQEFKIPLELQYFLNHGIKEYKGMSLAAQQLLERLRGLLKAKETLGDVLSEEIYGEFFHLLLYMEEHQLERDTHNYDMSGVVLEKSSRPGNFLTLKVPGLAEKRPSILINDPVFINFPQNPTRFEGRVHFIHDKTVDLAFHSDFHKKYNGEMVEISFNFNRHNLRSMHIALSLLENKKAERAMFPRGPCRPLSQPPVRNWFNPSLPKNPPQVQAINNIVWESSRNCPYIVFGPPGTGKTTVLVESILQIWSSDVKKNRILVCTPSNSAADVLTMRILDYMPKVKGNKKAKDHLLRMYAVYKNREEIPAKIREAECTNHDELGVYFPGKKELKSFDIVICTCLTAARIMKAEIEPGHFTHIFMDEVGQAMEPEALIPIASLGVEYGGAVKSFIVLAGDPKQLGPIVQSPIAGKLGLGTSLLKRLMNSKLYQKDVETHLYNSHAITKLTHNYRSHETLIRVPNKLFYDNELKPFASNAAKLCKWKGLKKVDFPLIFHGVRGLDERESHSPSYFNRKEVEIAVDYIAQLRKDGFLTKDVGVISPYARQVQKMRRAFAHKQWDDIKCGSVEEFQGQEKSIIVISTVRNNNNLLDKDYEQQLGFLKNPQRFNVAITRACHLLIVIGNPLILKEDYHWRELIKFAKDNGVYKGEPIEL